VTQYTDATYDYYDPGPDTYDWQYIDPHDWETAMMHYVRDKVNTPPPVGKGPHPGTILATGMPANAGKVYDKAAYTHQSAGLLSYTPRAIVILDAWHLNAANPLAMKPIDALRNIIRFPLFDADMSRNLPTFYPGARVEVLLRDPDDVWGASFGPAGKIVSVTHPRPSTPPAYVAAVADAKGPPNSDTGLSAKEAMESNAVPIPLDPSVRTA
jgi:hypothetical protein